MKYYIRDKEIIKGPIDEEIIRKRMISGAISSTSLISNDQISWKKISDIIKIKSTKVTSPVLLAKTIANFAIKGTEVNDEIELSSIDKTDIFDGFCTVLYAPNRALVNLYKYTDNELFNKWILRYFMISVSVSTFSLFSALMLFDTYIALGVFILFILPLFFICSKVIYEKLKTKGLIISCSNEQIGQHFRLELAAIWYIFMWTALFVSLSLLTFFYGDVAAILGCIFIFMLFLYFFYQLWAIISFDYLAVFQFSHKQGVSQ